MILFQRQLPGDNMIVVYRMMFNDRVCFGPNDWSWIDSAFCFPQDGSALVAAETWDGEGDPPGPWIKDATNGRYREPGVGQIG